MISLTRAWSIAVIISACVAADFRTSTNSHLTVADQLRLQKIFERGLEGNDLLSIYSSVAGYMYLEKPLPSINKLCGVLEEFGRNLTLTVEDIHYLVSTWNYLGRCQPKSLPSEGFLKHKQLTPGDSYGAWFRCKLTVQNVSSTRDSEFVKALHQQMTTRDLFDNDASLAALFLDPRYSLLIFKDPNISEGIRQNKKSRAIKVLKTLYRRTIVIEACIQEERRTRNASSPDVQPQITQSSSPSATVSPTGESNDSSSSSESDSESQAPSEAEAAVDIDILDQYIGGIGRDDNSSSVDEVELEKLLIEFSNQPQQDRKSKVLDYWETKAESSSILYELALIVCSLPMTQVSVERLSSGMKFLISDQRTRLQGSRVEEILLLRTNGLFEKEEKKGTQPRRRRRQRQSKNTDT